MIDRLRAHTRLTELALVGVAVVVSVSLTDELGTASALALGVGALVLTNLLLRRWPR